ncbi:MAG: AMP-binding protein [bacterium]
MSELNVYQVLRSQTKNFEDKAAIVFGEHFISYRRLFDAIERLASSLSNLGVRKGDRFAIMLPNLPQFVICYFALLKLGVAVIPVNTRFKETEVQFILEDARPRGVVAWDRFTALIQRAVEEIETCNILVFLGDSSPANAHNLTELIAEHQPSIEDFSFEVDTPAVISYTAGTTGQPKGAVFSHSNIKAQIVSMQKMCFFLSSDVVLCMTPLFDSFGHITAMTTPLVCGATVVLLAKFDPQQVVNVLKRLKVSVLIGRPKMFRALNRLEVQAADFPDLKYCLVSWGLLPEKIKAGFEQKFGKLVYEGYSITEGGPLVAMQRIDLPRKQRSVGHPGYQVEVRVVDEGDQDVPMTEVGEILVSGPNVMAAYLEDSERTNGSFKNGWLHTGDVGRFDEEGNLYIEDRKCDTIFKGGFHVYPREVEAVLTAHPKVQECAVIGLPDRAMGEEVHALVVLKHGATIEKEKLLKHCRERLEPYKCPKNMEFVKSIPRSSAGQVLKWKLREEKIAVPQQQQQPQQIKPQDKQSVQKETSNMQ